MNSLDIIGVYLLIGLMVCLLTITFKPLMFEEIRTSDAVLRMLPPVAVITAILFAISTGYPVVIPGYLYLRWRERRSSQ